MRRRFPLNKEERPSGIPHVTEDLALPDNPDRRGSNPINRSPGGQVAPAARCLGAHAPNKEERATERLHKVSNTSRNRSVARRESRSPVVCRSAAGTAQR